MATGGVYLGGGIAPKIVEKLKEHEFMNAFTAKARMKPLLHVHLTLAMQEDRQGLRLSRKRTVKPTV